jgi:hypothetical protein
VFNLGDEAAILRDMVKKLISRSEMARRAGVSPAAVTKVCNTILKPACAGKRIDVDHPVAVEYIKRNTRANEPPAATGLDNLYEDVIERCQSDGNYTSVRIQRDFKIGHVRAGKILVVMRANGLVPEKGQPPVEIIPPKKPVIRGNAAVKERKKRESTPDDELIEIPEDIQTF